VICTHGREVISANRAAHDRIIQLGQAVLNFHAYTEKEEQKRIECISKEHLKALKADDEEAYMKLIDTAKDSGKLMPISIHLLRLLLRICKHRIVCIGLAKPKLYSYYASLLRKVLKRRCISVLDTSLTPTTRSSKLVVSTTNLRKRAACE
jgi:hypothetical protein